MKVLVTGASGLVGKALIAYLKNKGDEVFKLVRGGANLHPDEISYDVQRGVINLSLLEGFDAVVHLAGENIMGRWTEAKKRKIKESRVKGTALLSDALSKLHNPPKVFVVASAIGFYGDRGDEKVDEQSCHGKGFLAGVCEEWEKATDSAAKRGLRVINLRIGMVLSSEGGALKQMLPAFRMGIGGRMGSGKQIVSWIALDDLVRVIDFVIDHSDLKGIVNAVSPHPVTNQEMTNILGRLLHRPTFLAMPSFIVKLVFGELGEEVLLSSTYVVPKKLQEAGFQYSFPYYEDALREVLKEEYF